MILKNLNDMVAYINEVKGQIDAEAVSRLDFDRLKSTLDELAIFVETATPWRDELELLREDYIRRISGMEKAIAVVKRGSGHFEQALARIDSLKSLSAAELIEIYRCSQARFRDSFPASFGLVDVGRTSHAGRRQDISQFK